MPRQITFCFPFPTDNVGISYTALSIYRACRRAGRRVAFVTPVVRGGVREPGIRQAVPPPFRFLPWSCMRWLSMYFYRRAVLAASNADSVIYLWSNHSVALIARAKARGAIVIQEKFNCARQTAKAILTEEFRRNSLPDACAITDGSVRQEAAMLAAVDYVYCPSPMVTDSLRRMGVPQQKLIATSFGWDGTGRILGQKLIESRRKRPRFLYVGSVEFRKGAHLLLQYWKEARIDGTLIFMGAVRNEMRPAVESLTPSDNVVFLGHVEKAHGVYGEADVFVFPSLEDGGPLVTYEAMGRGLPVIVSPMGAGAVARNGVDGRVLDPHDRQAWVNALREMAADSELRKRCSDAAQQRALDFTWDRVGRQRHAALLEKLSQDAVIADATPFRPLSRKLGRVLHPMSEEHGGEYAESPTSKSPASETTTARQ